jgi:hypothetical protein
MFEHSIWPGWLRCHHRIEVYDGVWARCIRLRGHYERTGRCHRARYVGDPTRAVG